jgi:hypothetical protein
MRIRLKQDHREVREVSMTYGDGDWQWWTPGPMTGQKTLYSEREWEEVPQPQWVPARVGLHGDTLIVEGPAPFDTRMEVPSWLRIVSLPNSTFRFEVRR